ncbi:hypothetical protein CCAX7_19750 [Capsulimonas corticalis]|uniref:Uncharacterized protein n=1 Tax=Capsulimonas corticalis TaxID=2219043 RepID=A0A402D2J9_9BACT|nr:hypothetical protein [Capsulimonas corticalis]BDI29924.1 hypothetical protein CCAX7_19750 [Capsulimonas corticalis]
MSAAPAALYHAAPLHYLPHILQCGMLRCASVLAADGIAARPGARRRDRMLGLSDWVHLAPRARTPLLADKVRRGYPHALLIFDGPATLSLPGVALLPQNTKAWRARAAFEPVVDPASRARLMDDHLSHGRHPSMEILVQYALGLETLVRVALIDSTEAEMARDLTVRLGLARTAPLSIEPELFPGASSYYPQTLTSIADYFHACRAAGRLTAPPSIPFD